jgi:hypothetical protein
MHRVNKVEKHIFNQNSACSFQSTSSDAQPDERNTVLHNAASFKAKPSFEKQEQLKLLHLKTIE